MTGARPVSSLRVELPAGWSALLPFDPDSSGAFAIEDPDRILDRPTGWMLLGEIGVRRETIAGTRVAVGAPVGYGARRMDALALLNWTLPVLLTGVLPQPPQIVNVVIGPDPMWRGGLSGPASVFLHMDRPLISEDGSSPLLHELAHTIFSLRTVDDADWLDEGLAEYLSLHALAESGTISAARFERVLDGLEKRSEDIESLVTANASGAVTARAVMLLRGVDAELQLHTEGYRDILDVALALRNSPDPVDFDVLRTVVTELAGRPLESIDRIAALVAHSP